MNRFINERKIEMEKDFLVYVDMPEVRNYTFIYKVKAKSKKEARDKVKEGITELEPVDKFLDNNEWLEEKARIIDVTEE